MNNTIIVVIVIIVLLALIVFGWIIRGKPVNKVYLDETEYKSSNTQGNDMSDSGSFTKFRNRPGYHATRGKTNSNKRGQRFPIAETYK